eukprot:SAG22_NODE_977_length_6195_cov_6.522060_5_plen_399_part_00
MPAKRPGELAVGARGLSMRRLEACAGHVVAAATTHGHGAAAGDDNDTKLNAAGLAAAKRAGLPTAAPAEVGLSAGRLGRLTAYQRGLTRDGLLPCAATVVARRGKVCYWEQCGEQSPGTPLAHDTIYRIYSMGKPITTVAVLILMEQGKCRLTDPLKLHLPLFAKENLRVLVQGGGPGSQSKEPAGAGAAGGAGQATEPCATDITILQLLTHTSGLTYDLHMMNGGREWPGKGVSMTDWMAELASRPLRFQPGSRWEYSVRACIRACSLSRTWDTLFWSMHPPPRSQQCSPVCCCHLGLSTHTAGHRPARHPGRGAVRAQLPGLPGAAALRPARHAGHRLCGHRRDAAAVRGQLRRRPAGGGRRAGRAAAVQAAVPRGRAGHVAGRRGPGRAVRAAQL